MDELALELGDGVLLVPQFVAHGWLSKTAARKMTTLDQYLDELSGEEHASLWTTSALREATQWEQVRRLARRALEAV